MTDAIVELTDISKDYRGLRPLRIKSLSVAPSDQVAILGLDQVTAEVLVNLLTGASLPDRGVVRILGRSTASIDNSDEWLSFVDRFGIVSERAVLLDGLTVLQNLAMPFTLEVEPLAPDVQDRAARVAEDVGLAESTWRRPVSELGPGDRLRVRIGRALALGPAILLLEHASAGIPRADVEAIGRDVRAIASHGGYAVIAATADETFAQAAAARVLTLDPATGHLAERKSRRWFGGRLG